MDWPQRSLCLDPGPGEKRTILSAIFHSNQPPRDAQGPNSAWNSGSSVTLPRPHALGANWSEKAIRISRPGSPAMGMAARSTGFVQQRIALMRYAIKAIFEVRRRGRHVLGSSVFVPKMNRAVKILPSRTS